MLHALVLAAASAAAVPSWMHVDAAHKKVAMTISMAAGEANGTLNFNGYGHGDLTITVPTGWNVDLNVVNVGDGAIPHSLEVIPVGPSLPAVGVDPPAFAGAETTDLVPGMAVGASDHATFVADKPGRYWLFCGVAGHGTGGMWDYFVVSSSAKRPSVTIKHGRRA